MVVFFSILSSDLFSYSFLILANSSKNSFYGSPYIKRDKKARKIHSLNLLVHTCNTATNLASSIGLNFLFLNFESKMVSSDKAASFPE